MLKIRNILEFFYLKSFDKKTRDKNKRTNLGNMYLDKINIDIAIIAKAKVISFIK